MDFVRNTAFAAFILFAFGMLSVQDSIVRGYGYTVKMPVDSVKMYRDRPKRSLATICVEIKPSGPQEEPYYMCKGSDLPTFPKVPSSSVASNKFGNAGGASESAAKQSTSAYNENAHHGTSFDINIRGGGSSGTNFQNFANKYNVADSGDKSISVGNTEMRPSFHQQHSSVSGGSSGSQGSMTSSNSQNNFNNVAEAESLRQRSSSVGYHHPTEHYQPQYNNEHSQQFQPHHQLAQNVQHLQQQFRSNEQLATSFQQNPQFFHAPTKSEQAGHHDKLDNHDLQYTTVAGDQSVQHGHSASYSSKQSSGFESALSPTGFNHTTSNSGIYASRGSNEHQTTQHVHGAEKCGEDCRKSIAQSATTSGSPYDGQHQGKFVAHNSYDGQHQGKFVAHNSYDGQHQGKFVAHNRYDESSNTKSVANSGYDRQSAAQTVSHNPFHIPIPVSLPNGGDELSAVTQGVPLAHPSMVGPSHPPSIRAPIHTAATAAVKPTERAFVSHADHPNSFNNPTHMRQGVEAFNANVYHNEKARYDSAIEAKLARQQGVNLHAQQQSAQRSAPSASRYRAMIDEDVLQVPNWGFKPEELDLYRAIPGDDPLTGSVQGVLSLPIQPRLIPLEHLEDPVMRSFYSSLSDVGPLPTISYIDTRAHNIVPTTQQPAAQQPAAQQTLTQQPPTQQPLTTYSRPSTQQMPYSPQVPCTPPQQVPYYYNYSPCPPREYSFQPVFIALPCYGQSSYPGMLPSNTPSGYDPLGMASPLADPLTRFLAFGNPITHFLGSPQATPTATFTMPTKENPSADIRSNNSSKTLEVALPKPTLAPVKPMTPKTESKASVELIEDQTVKKAKSSDVSVSQEANSRSEELKDAVGEKITEVKFSSNVTEPMPPSSTTVTTPADSAVVPLFVTTPSSTDSLENSQEGEIPARTTFKSLILTARKLSQMVQTSDEEDPFKTDNATPRAKRQRQASKAMMNGNSGGKRKYMQ